VIKYRLDGTPERGAWVRHDDGAGSKIERAGVEV